MSRSERPDTMTVLYDGECPLCRREMAHVMRLAERSENSGLCFVDISAAGEGDNAFAADRDRLLARFHIQKSDGSRLDGAAAFVAMWERLPGWRWLGRLGRLPGMLAVMELAYQVFLLIRPSLQRLARWKLHG